MAIPVSGTYNQDEAFALDNALLSALTSGQDGLMIAGDTSRFVDVPAVMAANTARFRPPVARSIAPTAASEVLPEIFQAVQPLQRAASKITGYDPANPPNPHTLSEQQYNSLPPLLRHQYEMATEQRVQKIRTAKQEYETLLDRGVVSSMNAVNDKNRVALRNDEEADRVVNADLTAAAQTQQAAESKLQEAATKFSEWRTKVDTAVSRGWLRVDPKTKAITPTDRTIPGQVKAADERIAERATIEKEIDAATKAQTESARDLRAARNRAGNRKQSTQPKVVSTSPSETSQPAMPSVGQVIKGYRYRGGFPPSDQRAWEKVK